MEFLRVPYSVLLFFAFTFWFLACFFDVFVSLFPSMMMTYKLYHLLPPPSSFLDTVGIIIFDRSLLKITLRLRVSHRGLFFITLDNFVPIYLEPTLKCLFVVLLLLLNEIFFSPGFQPSLSAPCSLYKTMMLVFYTYRWSKCTHINPRTSWPSLVVY